jgi:hypothetical protein
MQPYRFIGTEATIPGAQPPALNRFGQPVQVPEDMIEPALRSSIGILPEHSFTGWTDAELGKYHSLALIHDKDYGSDDVRAKFTATLKAYHDYRESVLNPPAAQPATVKEEVI